MTKKKLTLDDVVAWWKAGTTTDEEREEFVDALVKSVGADEIYWQMVDAAGGEEAFEKIVEEHRRKASLS